MKISELIKELELIKSTEGDLECCTSEPHEYWGIIYNKIERITDTYISGMEIDNHAQPKGPKSGESEKCLVFKY